MAKKRGFFAEVQHQAQIAQRQRQQQSTAAIKAHAAAVKRAEAARQQAARAAAAYARMSVAEQKAAEKEAKRLHDEAMLADVDQLNAELAAQFEQIDGMLVAALAADNVLDLESLREVAVHPPFGRPDLELATPRLPPLPGPPEPRYVDPDGAPTGLGSVFGGKKRYAELVNQARAEFAHTYQAWQQAMAALPAAQELQDEQYRQLEVHRLAALAQSRAAYDAECAERDNAAAERNGQLETLIANLGYGVDSAIHEYVSIVLSNSVYPECFSVDHDFEYDSALRELALRLHLPAPSMLPNTKEYRYTKAKDEITSTLLPTKDQKDRYANAVAQVTLRTLHEVFEADRAGRIETISLTALTEAIDVATGRASHVPLVAVAADRPTFISFDLANVVPQATLQHLGATVSKNPFDLVPIDTSKGVRGH